jgi:flavodoxin
MLRYITFYLTVLLLSICHIKCQTSFAENKNSTVKEMTSAKIKGLNFVAPRRNISTEAIQEVKAVNAGWLAVIPYGFTALDKPGVRYHKTAAGWWGESPEGVRVTIDSAQNAGLKVMLKPQIWIRGGWTGGMDYAKNEDWEAWEKEYEEYIMTFLDVAIEKNIDMFCVGTEFKMSATKREAFWRGLIQKIRTKFKGKLTYAANWDEYDMVPFWDALDMVGVDAYFPLVNKVTPSVEELQQAWKPIVDKMKSFHKKVNKPIAFTEYGYLDTDGCAFNSWEIEKKLKEVKINQQAQANAIEALLKTFWKESWWHGGFVWKWYPERGVVEKDYSPQKKLAERVLKNWYGK